MCCRALRRATGYVLPYAEDELWETAFDAAEDLRSMFNQAEILATVPVSTPTDASWRPVPDYCRDGNLRSVLDKYFSLGGSNATTTATNWRRWRNDVRR